MSIITYIAVQALQQAKTTLRRGLPRRIIRAAMAPLSVAATDKETGQIHRHYAWGFKDACAWLACYPRTDYSATVHLHITGRVLGGV